MIPGAAFHLKSLKPILPRVSQGLQIGGTRQAAGSMMRQCRCGGDLVDAHLIRPAAESNEPTALTASANPRKLADLWPAGVVAMGSRLS
jgi:hypothetical protein